MMRTDTPSIFDAFFSTAENLTSIAKFAPLVVMMRSDALLSTLGRPGAFDSAESLRMVSEKIAAASEGVMQATIAAGAAMESAFMTGFAQPDAAFRIANAALEPTRRCVEANFDRLTRPV